MSFDLQNRRKDEDLGKKVICLVFKKKNMLNAQYRNNFGARVQCPYFAIQLTLLVAFCRSLSIVPPVCVK